MRATQIGVSIGDMELLTVGMIIDMYQESLNDYAEQEENERTATQADFDRF